MADISGTDSLPGIVLCTRGSPHPEESAVRGETVTVQCDKVYDGESTGHCGATEGRVFTCHGEMGKGRLELGLGRWTDNLLRGLFLGPTQLPKALGSQLSLKGEQPR